METVRIGMAGYGTVGSGLARVLAENRELIARRTGKKVLPARAVVRDLAKPRNVPEGMDIAFSGNLDDLVNDPDIRIVVELMGGVDAAYGLVKKALGAGKHVVTANKALLAERGGPLFKLAAEKNLGLYYEASCAGAIPIVQTLKESLAGNRIERITGILNGTSNYILSEMTSAEEELDFDTALARAQELGYAEADPTLDIGGGDTAHKLALLIRLAFDRDYPFANLKVAGIQGTDRRDIEYAREFGYRLKLIAHAAQTPEGIEAWVGPALVKYTYLLARVGGNYNAVRVTGNASGPIFLHGQGAGSLPTASAVTADILAMCRDHFTPAGHGPGNALPAPANQASYGKAMTEHYFRFTVADKPGVMASIAGAMADHGISIAQAVQKGQASGTNVPIMFLTHEATMEAAEKTLADIDAKDFITRPTVHYRILLD